MSEDWQIIVRGIKDQLPDRRSGIETGVGWMIRHFLSRAESREEVGLSLARIGHVVINVSKQNHQSNIGKKALESQHA